MNKIAAALAGKFIVFDGPDGSGKSTQLQRFVKWCTGHGLTVCEVREPGGTKIGEQIRQVLLDPENAGMTIQCEMLLYMASRAQLVEQEIVPAMKRRELVVADRFVSATLAYQGAAGGLPVEWIQKVAEVAVSGHWPDLTLILDIDDETATGRLNPLLDRMELKGKMFHEKVREGFLDQANRMPNKYCVIDSSNDADTVEKDIQNAVMSWFCKEMPLNKAGEA
ncbi:MAG: dTMP kinase [Phycisphaerales bacterium]|jgi:dTMP kinase|nr:dTMP kinase [Phycisphaerales bacterium]